MDHGTLRQLAAGAALDDLDADEQRAFGAHVAACPSCAELAGDLDTVMVDLALVAPRLRPPASLRGDVLAALRAPAQAVHPGSRERADAPIDLADRRYWPAGRRPWRPATAAGVGIAAVLAVTSVGLGTQALELSDQMAAARVALANARLQLDARDAALTLMAEPGHVTRALEAEPIAPAASAMVVYRPGSREAYLMATGLPATPAGQVYQLWYADADGVHPLGAFQHDGNGPFIAPFGVDLASSAAAMVTLEPEGGAQGAPGPQVVFGEF